MGVFYEFATVVYEAYQEMVDWENKVELYKKEEYKDFKYIFYNAQLGFTFQMQLLFAPINLSDTEEIINKIKFEYNKRKIV